MLRNLVALLGIIIFVVFYPVIKPSSVPKNPNVKSALVSEPPLPVSKDIAPPEVTGTGIYITDNQTGVVLYEKNPHTRLMPASLTKISTALVAMDFFDDDSITSVKNGQNSNGNTIELVEGDELTARDLLYALLVRQETMQR